MEIYRLIERNQGVAALEVGDISMESHQPWALAKIAREGQGLKLVVCNLLAPLRGREKEWRLSLELLNQENVWFDLAALCLNSKPETYPYPAAREYVKYAVDIVGADRLMWGSDMPSAMTRDTYQHFIDFIAQNPLLREEEKEKIFYENAKQVYFS